MMIIKYGTFEIDLDNNALRYVGEQPKTLKQAWKITLSKWCILSNFIHDHKIYDGDSATCGLCKVSGPWCKDCPVSLDGHPSCSGTPFIDYRIAKYPAAACTAARAELKYLKKLWKRWKKNKKQKEN